MGNTFACLQAQDEPGGESPLAAAQREAREHEAWRNRFRTPQPGAGLPLGQIETVLYHYRSSNDNINIDEKETQLLLLKDGTGYSDIRWTPHDLDFAASRQGEPNAWFTWRRKGAGYERQGRHGERHRMEGGECTPLRPAPQGHYGRFTASKAGLPGLGTNSSSTQYILFGGDGRYQRGGGSQPVTNIVGAGNWVHTHGGSASVDRGRQVRFSGAGYTTTLQRDDSKVNRYFACWRHGRQDALVWGSTAWLRGE